MDKMVEFSSTVRGTTFQTMLNSLTFPVGAGNKYQYTV